MPGSTAPSGRSSEDRRRRTVLWVVVLLGLEPADAMDEENLLYRCANGTSFLLYKTDNAGTAKNTQMGWGTDNIEAEVEDLRGRGVAFEEYDFPGLKTENGIAATPVGKAAWFTDSEGNILNIFQRQ